MPTAAECQELESYTDKEWVNDFNGSGINGVRFYNNSKYIFFPASGFRRSSSFINKTSQSQILCADLYSDPYEPPMPDFPCFMLYVDNDEIIFIDSWTRCNALTIRGVRE